MNASLKIAVIGGSIGGLTAACLLRDAGHDVTVYERSSTELEQRGAGIGLLEATYRYLVNRADVALPDVSVTTDYIRYLGRDDTVVYDAGHRYLFSSWNTVYRRLLAHWGTDRYRLGHGMTGFEPVAGSGTAGSGTAGSASEPMGAPLVTVHFDGRPPVTADLLVCADGVGSTARSILQPGSKAGYAGYVAWRGMVPEGQLPADLARQLTEATTYYVYANSHILVYPIPGLDGSVATGDRLINFVWYRNYLEGPELDELMTDRNGTKRDLSLPPGTPAPHHVAEVKATAAARLPSLVAEVVARTEQPFLQVVYDIEVERMAFDRVCLLGDAAFAARPHAAAGSAKAAEDAWALEATLTAHVSTSADVPDALRRWEAEQLALGRSLLRRSREVGLRSQVTNTWDPANPDLIFGLHEPGR
jgi:2,6-dihydroxypyridine 3-monooxygenase